MKALSLPRSGQIPSPSTVLAEPNLVEMASGSVLYRVHRRNFAGNGFNPCRGGPTRFAPIRDSRNRCIPSLYAGSTVAAAIYESIFHDIPPSVLRKTVPRLVVEDTSLSALLTRRTLQLASLRAPDLMKWGIQRESLIGSLPTQYHRTAMWAKAIHEQFDFVDGLIWTSNRCDPDDALLLFGSRVAEEELAIVDVRGGGDASFLNDVRKAGERSGIRITR